MKIGSDWWTAPTESESGRLIMATGRGGMEEVRASGKYNIRIEITWKYSGDKSGMPDFATSTLMEAVHEALTNAFKKDRIAVMTGVYTGDDERNWVFYTRSIHIFNRVINNALADFELLPITIYSENDSEWNEYDEMRELSEIAPGD
ncbi:MAG: DUF695 domain-containing protein [Muribaculaceae bacterium]|nr:DUF695 domain-containing protein [Muribaculaceae bacterium]